MPPKKKKASGNASAGEKSFKSLCSACHSLSSHSVGPALGGLPGQNIAASEGYAYSNALQSKATVKWTDGNLDKWLKSPSGFAPGNNMAFAGLANPKDRADIIAYLKGG